MAGSDGQPGDFYKGDQPLCTGHRRQFQPYVRILGPVTQDMVHQDDGKHGLRNRRCTNADTGIMPAGGNHLDRPPLPIDRPSRQTNTRGGFQCDTREYLLTGRDAAQNPSGMITQKTIRCNFVPVLGTFLLD